ncbi:MAG: glycosyltransferase family 4 protein, partial [Acidobacteriota bacterium]
LLARTARDLGLEARVIPNVLDLEGAPFRHRERVGEPLEILWVRTFHDLYRPELAVEVLARLVRRGTAARLTLAGQDKGREAACRELAQRLGLADRVRFPGFLGAEAKRREFARHDVYLHTNRVDNMPVTVLEAAAFGLPVVAAAVGGVPDLLEDGRTGLLIADGDEPVMADAMAGALEGLVGSPRRVSRLSSAGRELAEQSGWPAVHRRWLELFGQILAP